MTTRADIRNQLKAYSQRRNIPDDQLNEFIEMGLSKANRLLRIPPLEGFTSQPVDSNGFFPVPELFLEVIEITTVVNDKTIILERKASHEIDWDNNRDVHDPRYFARQGLDFRISSWAVESGSVNMYIYNVIPRMTDDSQSNWFTDYAPEVLIYGAMNELAKYTRDDEGMARWNQAFNEEINILQGVEDRSAWAGSTLGISLHGSTR